MDKVREEFEKFYSKQNQYGEAHKQELWEVWKASRESIVVDLPRCRYEEQQEYQDELLNSLDKVGVRYE